jgi:hypothetical protein
LSGDDSPFIRLSELAAGEGVPAAADRLFVRLPSGACSVFDSPAEGGSVLDVTVRRLAEWAALRQAVKPGAQRLYLHGSALATPAATLRQCGLRSGALLHCAQVAGAPAARSLTLMRISVSQGKGPGWRRVEVLADPLDAAGRLKQLFHPDAGESVVGDGCCCENPAECRRHSSSSSAGPPIAGQSVHFGAQAVHDDATLADAGVGHGTSLHIAAAEVFSIRVHDQAGGRFVFRVPGGATPLPTLKQAFVDKKSGWDLTQARFVADGCALRGQRTLDEVNVDADSVVDVFLEQCGGMFKASSGRRDFQNLMEVDDIEASGGRPVEVVLPDLTSVMLLYGAGDTVGALKARVSRAVLQRDARRAARVAQAAGLEGGGVEGLRRSLRAAQAAIRAAQA